MKSHLIALSLLALSLTANAQDWKKDYPVSDLTGLQADNGVDVYLTQGNTEKLTIEVKGFDENEVRATVQNGTLMLGVNRRSGIYMNGKNRSIKAYLTVRQLRNIQVLGGSDLIGQTPFTANDLNVQVMGGADLKMTLKANQLNLQLSGGADVDLQGSARTFNAEGSGGADLDAAGFVTETCTASAHGGADMNVNATREISLKAAGGSDISYSGPAKLLSKSASGGSDITRRD
ncbi:MAG: DUF2807 domain-containing protein [Cytophagales bacterium]|nr:MAG: DUF2807 domain-containing protein [Cytophagales bacterium]